MPSGRLKQGRRSDRDRDCGCVDGRIYHPQHFQDIHEVVQRMDEAVRLREGLGENDCLTLRSVAILNEKNGLNLDPLAFNDIADYDNILPIIIVIFNKAGSFGSSFSPPWRS